MNTFSLKDETQEENKEVKEQTTDAEALPVKEEAYVVIEGPLSSVYTKALMLAYSKEDTGTMSLSMMYNQDTSTDREMDSYVYVMDSDNLDEEELAASMEALKTAKESGKYKNVYLSLETHRDVTSNMQTLDIACEALGVRTLYNRSSAVKTVIAGVNNRRIK